MQGIRLIGLWALISASTLTAPAWAESPNTARPYEPWSGRQPYQRADSALRRDAPPPPLVAPPEHGRRPFELGLGFGFGLPRCSDGSIEGDRCTLLGSGLGGDLLGLYRLTPYFAVGADLGLNRFGADAGAHFAGVLGRVYFFDEGAVDPHLELALGGGSLIASRRTTDDAAFYEETASGPAARVGAGIDFWIGTSLRLGPALGLTSYLVDTVRRCSESGSCVEHSMRRYAHPTGFASLSVRLSIAFGKPM